MKRLTFTTLITAFFLMSACTDAEQILPGTINQEIDFTAGTDITQVPDARDVQLATDKTKTSDCNHVGELLPMDPSFCYPVILGNDEQMFEVVNTSILSMYLEEGAHVTFGYVEVFDGADCHSGTLVKLTCVNFLAKDYTEQEKAPALRSDTN